MLRKLAVVLSVSVFILAGCRGTDRPSHADTAGRQMDTSEGMIEYLNRQSLPTLKDVTQWDNKYGPGLKLTTAHYEFSRRFWSR